MCFNFRWSSARSEYKRVRPSNNWRVESTKWFLNYHLIQTIWDGSSYSDNLKWIMLLTTYHHLALTIFFWSSELDRTIPLTWFWPIEPGPQTLIFWGLNLFIWQRSLIKMVLIIYCHYNYHITTCPNNPVNMITTIKMINLIIPTWST